MWKGKPYGRERFIYATGGTRHHVEEVLSLSLSLHTHMFLSKLLQKRKKKKRRNSPYIGAQQKSKAEKLLKMLIHNHTLLKKLPPQLQKLIPL